MTEAMLFVNCAEHCWCTLAALQISTSMQVGNMVKSTASSNPVPTRRSVQQVVAHSQEWEHHFQLIRATRSQFSTLSVSGQQKFYNQTETTGPAYPQTHPRCVHQWNSAQNMLERVLEQEAAISAALMSRDLRRGEEINTLKDKDFCDVEDTVKLMAPVKLVTDTSMCEDKRPTFSMISPVRVKL